MSGYSDYQASQAQGRSGEASAVARSRARPSKRGKGKPKGKGGYGWGDGKGKIHTISLGQHKKNVKAKRASGTPAVNPLDDPSQVTGPQTLRQIYQSADAATGLRYGPQERALGLQQAQVPAWFQSYRDQVQGIQTGVKAGYDKAIADVGARQQAVTTGDNAGRAALMQAAQKDAAARGATVDPSLFANDVSAQTVRNQGQSDFASLLSAQGNANNSYFGGLQAAGSAAELGQKQRIASDRTALAGDKGLFRQGYVTDAQQTAHKNALEDAAFGLDQYKAQTSAANARSRVRTTKRNAAAQRKATAKNEARSVITSGPFAGLTHAQVRGLSDSEKAKRTTSYTAGKTKAKAAKPMSESARKTKGNIRTGVVQLREQDVNEPGYWKSAYTELVTKNGLDPVVARAMIQGARLGRLGPKTRQTLEEDYGITGLKFSRPKRRHGKSSGGGGGPHGTGRP